MMTTILRYGLPLYGRHHEVEMVRGARVLSVQMQGAQLCLWVQWSVGNGEWAVREDGGGGRLLDMKSLPLEWRRFEVVGTGVVMGEPDAGLERVYVGTAVDGEFVWHVFEWVVTASRLNGVTA